MTVTPDSSLYYISVTRPAFVYGENGNFLASDEKHSTNRTWREKTDYAQTSDSYWPLSPAPQHNTECYYIYNRRNANLSEK